MLQSFLAKQAVRSTNLMPIRAIITDSFSGRTARNLAASEANIRY